MCADEKLENLEVENQGDDELINSKERKVVKRYCVIGASHKRNETKDLKKKFAECLFLFLSSKQNCLYKNFFLSPLLLSRSFLKKEGFCFLDFLNFMFFILQFFLVNWKKNCKIKYLKQTTEARISWKWKQFLFEQNLIMVLCT